MLQWLTINIIDRLTIEIYINHMNQKQTVGDLAQNAPQITSARGSRVWQIDVLRGVAMILMTIFHALVDIRDFFGIADLRYFEPPLLYIGRVSAILFIFISGISCRFSRNNIKRGAKVFLCGMIVTVATYIFVRDLYIRFGILHFLGVSMILTGLFEHLRIDEKRERIIIWIAAPLSLFLGWLFSRVTTEIPFLFIFGVITPKFVSYDFYPLFPWYGIYLAGYAIGRIAAQNRIKLAGFHENWIMSALGALGKKSLIFYILHQPALLIILYVINLLIKLPK